MEGIGNRDTRISQFRKCWIQGSEATVVGVWGPSTSKELTANWTSPFEGESIGNKIPLAGGVAQAATDMTSVTTLNSRQVWEGNRPTTFNIELKLYALEDPDSEVMEPIRALEFMSAPDVNDMQPAGGRIPDRVCVNIGTRNIFTDMVIDSISQPYDKEIDSLGRFVRATLNVQVSTLTMISKDMLRKGYGQQA